MKKKVCKQCFDGVYKKNRDVPESLVGFQGVSVTSGGVEQNHKNIIPAKGPSIKDVGIVLAVFDTPPPSPMSEF